MRTSRRLKHILPGEPSQKWASIVRSRERGQTLAAPILIAANRATLGDRLETLITAREARPRFLFLRTDFQPRKRERPDRRAMPILAVSDNLAPRRELRPIVWSFRTSLGGSRRTVRLVPKPSGIAHLPSLSQPAHYKIASSVSIIWPLPRLMIY
jgi:hypothetical protein